MNEDNKVVWKILKSINRISKKRLTIRYLGDFSKLWVLEELISGTTISPELGKEMLCGWCAGYLRGLVQRDFENKES